MARVSIPALAAAGLLAALPVAAHHAFSAVFDENHTATISGVLTRVEWVNPHVYFYVQGKAESGGPEQEWAVESHPPMALRRAGLTRDMLVVGKPVQVVLYTARDGKPLGFIKSVQLADGRLVRVQLDPQTPPEK